MFGPIHRAIRFALSDALTMLGATRFDDANETAFVVEWLGEVLALCEGHLNVEEKIVLPALRSRLTGNLDSIAHAHRAQTEGVQEMTALGEALLHASSDSRVFIGRMLYLRFSTFMGENMLHMAEEEQVVQPLLERVFTDDELRAMHARILDSLTPGEREMAARWMTASQGVLASRLSA
jgi:hemerythrin-like domain-containing protein